MMKNKSKLTEVPTDGYHLPLKGGNIDYFISDQDFRPTSDQLSNFLDWAKACGWLDFGDKAKEAMINMYLKPGI